MMFDCIIVGGGIAGLQASIQLGRYQHKLLVLDANRGRSTLCRSYHNLLGWPDGVSGVHLRTVGRAQALSLGVQFENDVVQVVRQTADGFTVRTEKDIEYQARTLLLATGIVDNIPPIPGLYPALGLSIYVCPDCDGYECRDKTTVIIGAGDTGAEMALTLQYWTDDITYINHFDRPIKPHLLQQLETVGIPLIRAEVEHVESNNTSIIQAVILADGRSVPAERGFVAFGGNHVESDLAAELGVSRLNGRHILVNPRTKMTSIQHVWAAGDVSAHSEQVSIAMGDGSQAAIFIHKALRGESVPGYSPSLSADAGHK